MLSPVPALLPGYFPGGGSGTLTPITMAASLTVTPAFSKGGGKRFDAFFGFGSGAPVAYGSGVYGAAIYGGGTAPSMSVARQQSRTLTAALTLTRTMTPIQGNSRVFDVALTLTPAVKKLIPKSVLAPLLLNPTMAPRSKVFKLLAATLTMTGASSMLSKVFRSLAAGLTVTPTIAVKRVYKRTLAGALNVSGGLVFNAQKIKSVTFDYFMAFAPTMQKGNLNFENLDVPLNLNPVVVKKIPTALPLGMSLNPIMSPQQGRYLTLNSSTTLSAALNRQLFRYLTLNASTTITPAMVKVYKGKRPFDVNLQFTALSVKRLFISLPNSLGLLVEYEVHPIRARPVFNSSMTLTTAIKKTKANNFNVSLVLTPTHKNVPFKRLTPTLTLTPYVNRRVPQKVIVALHLNPFEHDQLTHPKWLLQATVAMATILEIHQRDYKRSNAQAVLLSVTLGEANLLSAELKGN